jgi:uncharacterized protein
MPGSGAAAFRIDSSRPLKHPSNFRLIFAALGRGAGHRVTGISYAGRVNARGSREARNRLARAKTGETEMARFEIADIECAVLGEAPTSADTFFDLGMMYSVGRNVPIDFVTAHKWFNLAALRGNAEAIRLRREIAEQMSETEIAQAQRAARAWLKAS